MRSPTRVEVDSSVYLESPDDVPQSQPPSLTPPKKKRSGLYKFLLFFIITNVIIFIKRKVQGYDIGDVLVYLGFCNVGMALFYVAISVVYLCFWWTWKALSRKMNSTSSPTPNLRDEEASHSDAFPSTPSFIQTPIEAPPPPYHIAVNSTPPPSYSSIYTKA